MKHLHIRPYHNSENIKFVKVPKDEQDRLNTIKEISGYGLPIEIDDNGIASVTEFQIETVDGWYPVIPTKIRNLKLDIYPFGKLMDVCDTKVSPQSSLIQETVLSMIALMYMAKGVGLAANQVGLDYDLFVMDENFNPYKEDKVTPRVLFNCRYIPDYPSTIVFESREGCLSVPGFQALIRRQNKIRVTYVDINFKEKHVTDFGQFATTIIQHEVDHLTGNCIHGWMSKPDRTKYRDLARKIKREDKKRERNK